MAQKTTPDKENMRKQSITAKTPYDGAAQKAPKKIRTGGYQPITITPPTEDPGRRINERGERPYSFEIRINPATTDEADLEVNIFEVIIVGSRYSLTKGTRLTAGKFASHRHTQEKPNRHISVRIRPGAKQEIVIVVKAIEPGGTTLLEEIAAARSWSIPEF